MHMTLKNRAQQNVSDKTYYMVSKSIDLSMWHEIRQPLWDHLERRIIVPILRGIHDA